MPSDPSLDRERSLVDSLNWILRSFTPSWLRSSAADYIDSDWAKICLAKSSKTVYWTLVQYSQGHRFRGSRVGCRGKSSSSL